jgi:hypothetical protein
VIEAGKIDLDVAYQISCLDRSLQLNALQDRLNPRPQTLFEKIQALWLSASAEERGDASSQIAELMGVETQETPRVSNLLFPDVEEEKQRSVRVNPTDAEFESFYQAFPCRVNKAKAKIAFSKAFGRLRKTLDPEQAIATIMNGVNVYARNANPERLCHPTTWLNGDRWSDDPGSIWAGDKPKKTTGNATFGSRTDEERATLQDAVF